jgi:hypothetical protein
MIWSRPAGPSTALRLCSIARAGSIPTIFMGESMPGKNSEFDKISRECRPVDILFADNRMCITDDSSSSIYRVTRSN